MLIFNIFKLYVMSIENSILLSINILFKNTAILVNSIYTGSHLPTPANNERGKILTYINIYHLLSNQ
jgi:hypothetical protein